MATEKQIAANRRNAENSTGPTTRGGRSRARLNAVTHGLTAREVIILDETEEAFTDFYESMVDSLHPENAIERHLAEEIAIAAWKIRRLHRIEAKQFDTEKLRLERQIQEANDPNDERFEEFEHTYLRSLVTTSTPEEKTNESDDEYVNNPARLLRRLTQEIATLSRYRATLERSLYRAFHQLERLQARRSGAVVLPPQVLDVNVDREERGSAGDGEM